MAPSGQQDTQRIEGETMKERTAIPDKFELAYLKRISICLWLSNNPGSTASEINNSTITPSFGFCHICNVLRMLNRMVERGELRREVHRKRRDDGYEVDFYRFWSNTLTPMSSNHAKHKLTLNIRPDSNIELKAGDIEYDDFTPRYGEIAPGHYRQEFGSAKKPNSGGQCSGYGPRMKAVC
jgi:hypothetical protein